MSKKRFNPWLRPIEAQKPLFLACEIPGKTTIFCLQQKSHPVNKILLRKLREHTSKLIIPRRL